MDTRPTAPPIVVACEFPTGEVRRLLATHVSLRAAFIVSMLPPEVGTVLWLSFQPEGMAPLPRMRVRVTTTVVVPGDASQTGFGVAFIEGEGDASAAIPPMTPTLVPPDGTGRPVAPGPAPHERRRAPRVHTNLVASIEHDGVTATARVQNLSMSGALLALGNGEPRVALGDLITLHILNLDAPESVCVSAEVVRITPPNEPRGFGVRFVDVAPSEEVRIEGLIIHAIEHQIPGVNPFCVCAA
jgi:Tfp pilus assembly protein PilZ